MYDTWCVKKAVERGHREEVRIPVFFCIPQKIVLIAWNMYLVWFSRSTVVHVLDPCEVRPSGCGNIRMEYNFFSSQKYCCTNTKRRRWTGFRRKICTMKLTTVRAQMKDPPLGGLIVLRLYAGRILLLANLKESCWLVFVLFCSKFMFRYGYDRSNILWIAFVPSWSA